MQEQMIKALIQRVATDMGVDEHAYIIETRNGTGGIPAALRAFERYANDLEAGNESRPWVVVLAIDSDCDPAARRGELADLTARIATYCCLAVAIPDPYVERWYLLDLAALKDALGAGPAGAYPKTCDKTYYKRALVNAIEGAGLEARLGGYEWADVIVPQLDLYQAARTEPNLGAFVESLRACFQAA
jgi:hypothetical protein